MYGRIYVLLLWKPDFDSRTGHHVTSFWSGQHQSRIHTVVAPLPVSECFIAPSLRTMYVQFMKVACLAGASTDILDLRRYLLHSLYRILVRWHYPLSCRGEQRWLCWRPPCCSRLRQLSRLPFAKWLLIAGLFTGHVKPRRSGRDGLGQGELARSVRF